MMTTALQNAQAFANATLGKSQSLFSEYTPGGTITYNSGSLVAGVVGINATAVERTVQGTVGSSYAFPIHLITPSVAVIAQHTSGSYPLVGETFNGNITLTATKVGWRNESNGTVSSANVTARWNDPNSDICLLKLDAPVVGVTPYKLIEDDFARKIGTGAGLPVLFVNPNLQIGINGLTVLQRTPSSNETTVITQQSSPWVSDSLTSVPNQSSGPLFTVVDNNAVLLAAIHTGTASPPPNEPAGPLLLSGQLQGIVTSTFGLSETIGLVDLSSFSSVSMSYKFSATAILWDTGVSANIPYPLGYDANRTTLCTFNNGVGQVFQHINKTTGVRGDIGNPFGLSAIQGLGSHPLGVMAGTSGAIIMADASTGDVLNSEQFFWLVNDPNFSEGLGNTRFVGLSNANKIVCTQSIGNLFYQMDLPPNTTNGDTINPDNTNGLPTPHATPNDVYGGGFPWNGGWLIAKRLNGDGSRAIGTLALLSLDRSTELATYSVAGVTDTIGAVMTDGTGIFGVSDNDDSGNATINFYIISETLGVATAPSGTMSKLLPLLLDGQLSL